MDYVRQEMCGTEVLELTEEDMKEVAEIEKENLDNNENLDGFMKSVFANEQSTENVNLVFSIFNEF